MVAVRIGTLTSNGPLVVGKGSRLNGQIMCVGLDSESSKVSRVHWVWIYRSAAWMNAQRRATTWRCGGRRSNGNREVIAHRLEDGRVANHHLVVRHRIMRLDPWCTGELMGITGVDKSFTMIKFRRTNDRMTLRIIPQ